MTFACHNQLHGSLLRRWLESGIARLFPLLLNYKANQICCPLYYWPAVREHFSFYVSFHLDNLNQKPFNYFHRCSWTVNKIWCDYFQTPPTGPHSATILPHRGARGVKGRARTPHISARLPGEVTLMSLSCRTSREKITLYIHPCTTGHSAPGSTLCAKITIQTTLDLTPRRLGTGIIVYPPASSQLPFSSQKWNKSDCFKGSPYL